jgi:hypothetical protein
MTKDEALKLALEALEADPLEMVADANGHMIFLKDKAITAIKEALAQPWEKFCDSNCVWTDHHPDCKLAQPEHGWTPERIAGMARLKEAQDKKLAQPEQPKVRTGNCLRVGVCASEGHKIAPQRTWVGLTDEEILTYRHMIDWTAEWSYINFARAIEVAHGIKGEA